MAFFFRKIPTEGRQGERERGEGEGEGAGEREREGETATLWETVLVSGRTN